MGNKNTTTLKPNDRIQFTMNFEYYTDNIPKKNKLSIAELNTYFHSSHFLSTINSYIENEVLIHILKGEDMNIRIKLKKSNIKSVEIKKQEIQVKFETVLLKNPRGKKKITIHKLFDVYNYSIKHYISSGGLIEQNKKYKKRGDVMWNSFTDVQLITK